MKTTNLFLVGILATAMISVVPVYGQDKPPAKPPEKTEPAKTDKLDSDSKESAADKAGAKHKPGAKEGSAAGEAPANQERATAPAQKPVNLRAQFTDWFPAFERWNEGLKSDNCKASISSKSFSSFLALISVWAVKSKIRVEEVQPLEVEQLKNFAIIIKHFFERKEKVLGGKDKKDDELKDSTDKLLSELKMSKADLITDGNFNAWLEEKIQSLSMELDPDGDPNSQEAIRDQLAPLLAAKEAFTKISDVCKAETSSSAADGQIVPTNVAPNTPVIPVDLTKKESAKPSDKTKAEKEQELEKAKAETAQEQAKVAALKDSIEKMQADWDAYKKAQEARRNALADQARSAGGESGDNLLGDLLAQEALRNALDENRDRRNTPLNVRGDNNRQVQPPQQMQIPPFQFPQNNPAAATPQNNAFDPEQYANRGNSGGIDPAIAAALANSDRGPTIIDRGTPIPPPPAPYQPAINPAFAGANPFMSMMNNPWLAFMMNPFFRGGFGAPQGGAGVQNYARVGGAAAPYGGAPYGYGLVQTNRGSTGGPTLNGLGGAAGPKTNAPNRGGLPVS